MAQKQGKNETVLARLRAEIVELRRKNQEQAAIIEQQNDWIADLRADVITYQKLFAQAAGTPPPMVPPPQGYRTIILQPKY